MKIPTDRFRDQADVIDDSNLTRLEKHHLDVWHFVVDANYLRVAFEAFESDLACCKAPENGKS